MAEKICLKVASVKNYLKFLQLPNSHLAAYWNEILRGLVKD